MNYYNEIKNKIIENEIYSKVKDYSKEKHKVITYYEIGRLLKEAGTTYGDDIIGKYSNKLMTEIGTKYNKRTLFRMRQFYIIFSNEKVSTLSTQLSWSHYTELLSIKDEIKLYYYLTICINQHIDVRTLRQKIKSNEYERLDEKTKYKLITKENNKIEDFIKNPIIIHTKNNNQEISEKLLKKLILEDLDNFLKELGQDFVYVGNEYKIKLGERYNYIDILLYNLEFKCFVVVELKVTELRSEYIGQIEKYMNYINKNVKRITDNETIGIIICKKENKFILEYCSNNKIFETTYKLND